MSFSVTKNSPAPITPSGPTPSGSILPLSFFDRMPFFRVLITDMIMVYGPGDQPAKVIREAVGKALVPYYPLAGRLTTDTDDGELSIACTGEGVWYVEATADCSLEDVNYLQVEPLMIPKEQILPSHPPGIDLYSLPFMIQVTQFRCGGFTFATRANHAVFDGIGAGQIKVAISEMARGLDHPTVNPVWCRDVISKPNPTPTQITPHQDTEQMPPADITKLLPNYGTNNIECRSFHLPLDYINHIKDGFEKDTGKSCSVFDVVASKLWQSRTRAIGLDPQTVAPLTFLMNIRRVVLQNALPGYYGNCLAPLTNKALSGQIATASIFEIVKLIKGAKDEMLSKDAAFLIADAPPPREHGYADLSVVDWRRLGFYEADFGWGGPKFLVPLNKHTVTSCSTYIFKSPVAPEKDVRLVTYCVVKEHLEAFRAEMNDFSY